MNLRFFQPGRSANGFTLVELLVVIAIIGTLVALLLPAVQSARDAARRAQCQSNIKQLCLATLNYESAHDELPTGARRDLDGGNNLLNKENWAILILPYIEQQALYDRYDFTVINEHRNNWPVLQTILSVQQCPSDEDLDHLQIPRKGNGNHVPMARGSYRANTGRCGPPHGAKWDSPGAVGTATSLQWLGPFHAIGIKERGRPYPNSIKATKMKEITDGFSNTLFLGESTNRTPTVVTDQGLVYASVGRRPFWAYTSRYYNTVCVYPESRTIIGDFARCDLVGGPGGSNACKHGGWGSLHPGGLHYSFGDGSVSFINTDINMDTLAKMASMKGGEVIEGGR